MTLAHNVIFFVSFGLSLVLKQIFFPAPVQEFLGGPITVPLRAVVYLHSQSAPSHPNGARVADQSGSSLLAAGLEYVENS